MPKNHQVDLFTEPYEDLSIQGVEYIPLNTNDTGVPGVTRQRFQIDTRDLDSYQNYARSYLKVKCRIDADAAGTALTAAQEAVLQNNGWSLFSKATLQINNTTIEEVENPGLASSMRAYIEWSKDYHNSHGSNGGFYIDTAAASGVANNSGFAVRHSLSTTSNSFCMMLPLAWVFGWAHDVDKVTKGLKFSLILNKASAGNAIHQIAACPNTTEVYIQDMKLFVPIYKPSLEVVASIENKLAQGYVQKCNYQSMNCYRSPTFQEATPTYRVSTNISTPVLCVVAAQLATVDGNRDANNQTFISNSITECELRVNNVAYPREKLETNFTAGQVDVARSYQMLLDWKNKHADQENGTLFSVIDYANTFPMFVFDLNNVEKGVFSADGNCDISFKCRMDGNTAVQFTFLILSESEAVISSNGSQISLERL